MGWVVNATLLLLYPREEAITHGGVWVGHTVFGEEKIP